MLPLGPAAGEGHLSRTISHPAHAFWPPIFSTLRRFPRAIISPALFHPVRLSRHKQYQIRLILQTYKKLKTNFPLFCATLYNTATQSMKQTIGYGKQHVPKVRRKRRGDHNATCCLLPPTAPKPKTDALRSRRYSRRWSRKRKLRPRCRTHCAKRPEFAAHAVRLPLVMGVKPTYTRLHVYE